MARRLTLILLLACAAALRRPPTKTENFYDSDSEDSYSLWEEYDEYYEVTRPPRRTATSSAKVILRGKRPEVNVTMKKDKSDDNKVIKTTNINIQSHTNFIVTKPPVNKYEATRSPVVQIGDQYVLVEGTGMHSVTKLSTRKPTTPRLPTTRRPSSTRRPSTTTRRSSHRTTRRTFKTTKAPNTKKTTCPPKNSGWLNAFFQETKVKKSPKKPEKSGIFTNIYDWIVGSKSSWFSTGTWFQDTPKPKKPTPIVPTSTTISPSTGTTSSWFHSFIQSEDSDASFTATDTTTSKKSSKKSLKKNYKGYQLLRTYPDIKWKVQELVDLQEEAQGSGLMWWTPPSLNGTTDLLVPPDLLVDVKDHLKSSKIVFDVVIWDLQKAITYENPRLSKKQRIELEKIRGHPMTWRRYHRYADILRYLDYLQHSYPDLVELVRLGLSSEGLPLVAVKISLPANETFTKDLNVKVHKKKWKLRSKMKPAIWLDGGAHAREWIAPAVATWMIHMLVEGEKGLDAELEVLKQADFYIMPVLNPDGYEHSHTHDRLWRKTRSRPPDQTDDYYFVGWFPWNWGQTECVGVDADRNWDYHWGEEDSSRDPCSDNFAGPHPFSEPETRAVSEFLTEHRGQIKVFISLHAYSQAWLVPSTHAYTPYGDDGVLMEMGKLATTALGDMFGTKYRVGTAEELSQPAGGMSHDWAKARAGIKFSYHVDLRDSFGPYGFLLPGSQIVSTARETWQAVKAIVDNVAPD
ncbi:carboxypeptidase A4 [Manduca sexta]|uniref:carboxypeptidase A4 n=1 Tax=Manduca sexta TaxID=7130 RepID=UPI00188F1B0C|nr:carboxypeptidase A4 [Manduca sexta]